MRQNRHHKSRGQDCGTHYQLRSVHRRWKDISRLLRGTGLIISSLWYYYGSAQGVWCHRWAKWIVKNDTSIKVIWFLGPTNTSRKHFLSSRYFHPRTSNIKTPKDHHRCFSSRASTWSCGQAEIWFLWGAESRHQINHQKGFSQKIDFFSFLVVTLLAPTSGQGHGPHADPINCSLPSRGGSKTHQTHTQTDRCGNYARWGLSQISPKVIRVKQLLHRWWYTGCAWYASIILHTLFFAYYLSAVQRIATHIVIPHS